MKCRNCENASHDELVREANLEDVGSPESFYGGVMGQRETCRGNKVLEEFEVENIEV
jgi:hypothetical protein